MKKKYPLMLLLFLFSCGNGQIGCLETWHSSLRDKSCGCNPPNSTYIRSEHVMQTGSWYQMRFNTPDKIYLFRDDRAALLNMTTKEMRTVDVPLCEVRDYNLDCDFFDSQNRSIMSGYYTLKSDQTYHYIVYAVDENLNFTDITPAGYDITRKYHCRSFYLNSNLYFPLVEYEQGTIRARYLSSRLLKYQMQPMLSLLDDTASDIDWAFCDQSQDNLIWSYDCNTRSDPSKIVFSFDGENYTYYGPGVPQNGPCGSFAIDKDNVFIGYYSGVVWQYDSGTWIKHAITREDEPGYSVGDIWASSKTNVFISGSSDIFDEQNFAYYYDGTCWTRIFKGDGYVDIPHIWGTRDGSTVLALDVNGNLYRLYVEK